MALCRLHPAFHVLLCLQAALASVEPPTNVTLHCHNLRNVLMWTYGQPSPGLRFKVNVYRYTGNPTELWVDPPDLQADLSFLNDPDNYYVVQLTAVIGQKESEPVPPDGITFSYFNNAPASQKCSLELPPVNVTAQPDAVILFRFLHPWLLYKEKLPSSWYQKNRSKKSHDSTNRPLPVFKYDVVINDQAPHEFTCVEDVCEGSLPVNAAWKKHCLTISGKLDKMAVKTTQLYCALPYMNPPQHNIFIYVILGSLAVFFAAAFVVFMLYRKKTNPSTPLPPNILKIKTQKHHTIGAEKVHITVPEVEPTTPTPLLAENENDEFSPTLITSDDDLRLTIGCMKEEEGVPAVVEEPINERSPYMDGLGLEGDGASSGYERREALISVDLGLDERAEGYRG